MKEKKKVQTENQERIKTPFSEMVRKFKKQKNAVVALCFIIFLIFLAFFGSKIVPYGINILTTKLGKSSLKANPNEVMHPPAIMQYFKVCFTRPNLCAP